MTAIKTKYKKNAKLKKIASVGKGMEKSKPFTQGKRCKIVQL